MAGLVHRVDTKQIKLTISLPRMFGFRMWLTLRLFALAAIVSPVSVEVSSDHS